ncbi:pr domain zinc finger protein [Holotrichia oblita]|uniref:Pr domain zinc finger protein n=1 Tax=Holotrichia oblita TaxID=644536 RepID=A0ACB9TYX1_HOLOL|nr:pr domain zinc finger protein [Holotrichia oblita]
MSNKANLTCRTCLKINKSGLGIFNHYEREKLLSEILIECTSVKVEKQDELPQYMCNNCVEKLVSAWDFKVMVIDSAMKFQYNLETRSDLEVISVKEEIAGKYEESDLLGIDVRDCDTSEVMEVERGDDDNESETNETDENPITTSSEMYISLDIQSSDDGYIFNEKGVPLTKDGRKLTGRERENVPIYCKHCNRSFRWKYYKVHLKLHQGDRPFKCDQCDSAFVQAHQLRNHLRVHTDEAPFSCDICGKTFKQSQNVYLHKAKHTDDRPHKCEICDKRFKQVHVLKQHLRQHDKDKWYMCELCGKSFTNTASFSAHKNTHTTGKTYPCPICDKQFPSPTHMKRHKRVTHSDKKPYVCNYCGRRFKEPSPLKRHILIHTGEKPYSCNICAKAFRQRECLTAHMRSHTGETPYVCEQCPAKFKFLHLLKKHKTVHDT